MMRENFKKMKRYSLTFLFLLVFGASLSAQNKTISGEILEPDGEPAIGATVMVKGSGIGTATDIDGKYSLSVPENAKTLVITYTGMATQEVAISGSVINVTLKTDATALEEVVAIGYATVRRKDLTGTVSSVGANELKDIPVATAAEAITGKLAGVQVTTTEGSPDADVKIRVRGGGSITGDNTPLYIVDGFPVSSINDIPPSEIKSIDVLKDASATAIYGSQGANGVIIVTTKDPSEDGKFSVNYDAYIGWKKIAKTLDVLSPGDYARWQYEMQAMRGGNNTKDRFSKYFNESNPGYALADYDAEEYNRLMSSYDNMQGTDWQDRIFGNTGFTQSHNISLMGGTQAASFNLIYNTMRDDAIMMASDYKRDNLSLKLNAKPLKWLKLGFTARYSDVQVKGSGANDVNSTEKSTADSRLKHSVIYTPIPLRNYADENSADEEEVGNLYPPDEVIYDNWKQTRKQNYNYNGSISATLMKGLVAKVELGLYKTKSDVDRFYGPTAYWARTYPANDNAYQNMGIATMSSTNSSRFRNANTLTFDRKNIQKSGHSFNIMLGQETVITTSESMYTEVAGLPEDVNYSNAFAQTSRGSYSPPINHRFAADEKLVSFFGRLNYDFREKYLFTLTMRGDGSSKFGDGNKWGFFPAAAFAWRVSDEEFMSNTTDWLSNLKLRLSYGTVGNDKIASTQYMKMYEYGGTNAYFPYYSNLYYTTGKYMANPDLKWETTITRNLGLDFGFFKNRLSGNLDFYLNNTEDLLLLLKMEGSGYDGKYQNIGSTQNKGVELTLNGVLIDKKNVGLDISANISMNRGKVKELDGRDEMFYASDWAGSSLKNRMDYVVRVGEPVGQMYGYVTEGRYEVDDFMWNGSAWKMNTAKYSHEEELADGTIIYKDASGKIFADNSGLTGRSWGPGALKLADLNGDGKITDDDQTIIGNSNPKASGGFSINARAHGFDLSANFTWMYGNKIYNANKIEFTSTGLDSWYGRNMITEMAAGRRWSNIDPETGQLCRDEVRLAELNANTTMWSPEMSNYTFHSWAVEDGSFLRLASLTLGYSLPKDLLKKIYVQNLRFYVTGNNLFCLTDYSGYDPEVDTRRQTSLTPGVDYSAYPKSRSIIVGVNIGF